jgi:glutathione peroxidase
VSFPLSTKIDVNGKHTDPVFGYLKKNSRSRFGSAIKWNFTKFLVAPDGVTVKRYSPKTEPEALRGDIEAVLSDAAA